MNPSRPHAIALTPFLLLLAACEPSAKPGAAAASASARPSAGATTVPSGSARPAATARAAEGSDELAYSRALVGRFAKTLKAALMKGMSGGGPVNAIKVCNTEAPAIAEGLEPDEGWSIRRTSLKLRNPHNEPDAWERAALEAFDKEKAAGTDPATLEKHEVVREGSKRVFRYMKAIPTAGLCLPCHGEEIPADVKNALDDLYPKDEARGFKTGDIRGAFSIRKEL